MKITMLTLQAGPNVMRQSGQSYDVPDKEAKELIAGGYAVEVSPAKAAPAKSAPAERAVRGKRGETAAKPEAEE
jgi:hypothetical protein